jgi:hypothetical protein
MESDPGADLERRAARIEFAEGALARTRVPVRGLADLGRDVLTDVDVLSLDVDRRLRVTRSVLECKSGRARPASQTGSSGWPGSNPTFELSEPYWSA